MGYCFWLRNRFLSSRRYSVLYAGVCVHLELLTMLSVALLSDSWTVETSDIKR
jgi:hypothetical protein